METIILLADLTKAFGPTLSSTDTPTEGQTLVSADEVQTVAEEEFLLSCPEGTPFGIKWRHWLSQVLFDQGEFETSLSTGQRRAKLAPSPFGLSFLLRCHFPFGVLIWASEGSRT